MSVLSAVRRRLWPDAPPPPPRPADEPAEHVAFDPAYAAEKEKGDAMIRRLAELQNLVKEGEQGLRQNRGVDDLANELLTTGEITHTPANQIDWVAVHEEIRALTRAIELHRDIHSERVRRDWVTRRREWLNRTENVRKLRHRQVTLARELLDLLSEERQLFSASGQEFLDSLLGVGSTMHTVKVALTSLRHREIP